MNMYQQHDCQSPKASAAQVIKMNFSFTEERAKVILLHGTLVCPGCQPKGLINKWVCEVTIKSKENKHKIVIKGMRISEESKVYIVGEKSQ